MSIQNTDVLQLPPTGGTAFESYDEALTYIFDLKRQGIKLSLDNISRALEEMGNPQLRYPSVHVAGTNGKGSTSVFLSHILEKAGIDVGLNTSPHVIDFRERIHFNNRPVKKVDIIALAAYLDPFIRRNNLTFFETVTSLAFKFFAEKSVNLAVVEVGLGGRLDATRLLDPRLSVVTTIDYDHTNILGNTLEQIAMEKVDILKEQGVLLTGHLASGIKKLMKDTARERSADFYALDEQVKCARVRVSGEGSRFDYRGMGWNIDELYLPVVGGFQVHNAALAVMAAEVLQRQGYPVTEEAVREGLAGSYIPGRMEIFEKPHLMLFDVAHNPHGISTLFNEVETIWRDRKILPVLGIVRTKDARGILSIMKDHSIFPFLSTPDNPRGLPVEELSRIAEDIDLPHRAFGSVGEALMRAVEVAREDQIICVCGSFFTVCDGLKSLGGVYDRGRIRLSTGQD